MPHVEGHIPNATLIIKDTLGDNQFHWVHGYLFLTDPKTQMPNTNFKILFQNNNKIPLPPHKKDFNPNSKDDWNARRVGFHLMWIDQPESDKKLGIAYDIVDWDLVEDIEERVEKIKGKKLEDISLKTLSNLADELAKKNSSDKTAQKLIAEVKSLSAERNLSLQNTKKLTALTLKQAAAYMESPFYKVRKGQNSYKWIKKNIQPFDLNEGFFGEYEPDFGRREKLE